MYSIDGLTVRRYFGDHDIDGMFATLAPLHNQVDKVGLVTLLCMMNTKFIRALKRFVRYHLCKHLGANFQKLALGVIDIVTPTKSAI